MKLEEAINRNGTITLSGIVFDVPISENLPKWEFSTYKDGRSVIKEIWLNTYERSANSVSRMAYCLKVSNYGKCTLEGEPLKGSDVEKAKALAESL